MRRLAGFVACAALALISPPRTAAAQSGGIRGRVAEAGGSPLAHATISVDGTPLRTSSNDRGEYLLGGVPAGTHTVRARVLGYVAQSAQVTVTAGENATRDFTLQSQPIGLSAIDVTIGSRARHTAADELAVPVDVFTLEEIHAQGTSETSQILSQLSPSVNFPRQSVADATDIVRPFTMRGLSPDQTLVLVNGRRRHHTALVHVFGAALGAGSSGVDMNAIPASAIERMEVLRDGAAAQYGSDAIAGVVNLVLRQGAFPLTISANTGRYITGDFPDDGTTADLAGSWGLGLGTGSVSLFTEYRYREPTNRAGADPVDQIVTGDADVIDTVTNTVTTKNNPVPQPNHHWGDGSSSDILTYVNAVFPSADRTAELYASGGYSFRNGTGNGFRRQAMDTRNWRVIYPLGFLPRFNADVEDFSGSAGLRGTRNGWRYDLGGSFGHSRFTYNLDHTLNASLGPCLDVACAPGPDGRFNTPDDPGIPNQTSFFAGELRLGEYDGTIDISRQVNFGFSRPANLAFGAAIRHETYQIAAGERASWIQGGRLDLTGAPQPPGSQVFPGFRPDNEIDAARDNVGGYVDLEANLSSSFLVDLASRFESYSDAGERLTWKVATRYQAGPRLTLRAAVSTGFRAPSLSQSWYSSTVTNFKADALGNPTPFEVGIFRVDHPAAVALGSAPLHEETSTNYSGGFAWSPSENFTITADYYAINVDGRILMTAELSGDSVAAILQRAGQVAEVARYFSNALTTQTRGYDITLSKAWALSAGRRLNLNFVMNYTKTEVTDSLPLPSELATAGVARFDRLFEGGLNAIEKERPNSRFTLTGRYTNARWSAEVRANHYGEYTSSLLSYTDLQTYGGKTLIDAEISRTFGSGMTLAIGGRNLFDTYPDRTGQVNSFGIMQFPTASPFGFNGRYLYARVDMQVR
jgi:iron complex outermembrane receptor protein